MIIVQTPLRVSFFGGGTDFSAYYQVEGGCVLSSSIDKYIFVTIKQRFDDYLRVGYTHTEIVETVGEIKHELIREALKITGIEKGVEITTMGDIPAGTGLGSSSAVTVGALHAMYAYQAEIVPAEILAQQACEIEIDRLGKPIGKQDQYISAYGGLRLVEFQSDEKVSCRRVRLDPALERRLNESLLLFYTGVTRHAETILGEQRENVGHNLAALSEMKQMAYTARDLLCQGNLERFGCMLDEAWKLKKSLARHISNGAIEEAYEKARQAGALGGKITGAGGGGFLLLFCVPERREAVREALSGMRELPFRLTMDGSKVIFNHRS